MAKKKIGIWMDAEVADRLDTLSEQFEGLKGELVAAALTMFMNASDEQKRDALHEVMSAKVNRLFGSTKDEGTPVRVGKGTYGPKGAKRPIP